MRTAWEFYDPVADETWEMDINPETDDFPGFTKNFSSTPTTAPDGDVLVIEGQREPRTGTLSGIIKTEAQFNLFHDWWDRNIELEVTDDLGRVRTILIEEFNPKRAPSYHFPWRHTYDLTYTIIDWPAP